MSKKKKNTGFNQPIKIKRKKCTSIGNSPRTRIKNKHKRRNKKKYRGQGK